LQEAFQRCARDCSRINFVHLAAVVDVERLRAFRRDLLTKILKQANISRSEWLRSG